MSHRSLAGVLLICTLFCFTGLASVQSSEPNAPRLGYWAGDKWIGYAPAKPKQKERAQTSRVVQADGPPAKQGVVPTNFQEEISLGVDEVLVDRVETNSDCADDCCPQMSSQDVYCAPSGSWGRAEYQLWWTDGMNAPPLVTTGPDNALQNEAGRLGQPGTRVLFGNSGLTTDARSGGRFTFGKWLDPCERWGVEATYMTLGEETESFAASNNNYTILARPFRDAVNNVQSAQLIAYPNFVDGNIG
ncbi:MAG TPA: BBP7 family outer membrane beta-barrel protein, partial [Thermoguttaceae bacterium]|nr:BBP7 family outer membrane beta-barrel protein [Thermoguttaceae bacterium]